MRVFSFSGNAHSLDAAREARLNDHFTFAAAEVLSEGRNETLVGSAIHRSFFDENDQRTVGLRLDQGAFLAAGFDLNCDSHRTNLD